MAINLKSVRKAAERLLLPDECQFLKGADRAGEGIWDPVNLVYAPPADQILYDGACGVSSINNFPSEIPQGGGPSVVTNYYVKIPAGAMPDIRPEDICIITAIHDGGDQMLVSQRFIVSADPEVATYTVLRQVRVRRFGEIPQ